MHIIDVIRLHLRFITNVIDLHSEIKDDLSYLEYKFFLTL